MACYTQSTAAYKGTSGRWWLGTYFLIHGYHLGLADVKERLEFDQFLKSDQLSEYPSFDDS